MSGSGAPAFVAVERVTRVACLGLRFWDPVTATPVVDGLRVTERASGRVARRTRSGVLVLWELPGFGEAERGAGDDAFWDVPPTARRATVDVVDELGRYLDCRFDVLAPSRGPAGLMCPEQLPAGTPHDAAPVFSRPSRPVPAGFAAVRAELVDGVRGGPATDCVVALTPPGGPTALGVSDERGRVLVLLPVPEPVRSLESPPGDTPPSQLRWAVGVEVRHAGGGLRGTGSRDVQLDLCDLLAQPSARLSTVPPDSVPVTSAELVLGRDLLLDEGHGSVLLVLPAA